MKVRACRTLLSSLRTRLVLLVLLAIVPALGLILYTASAQRRSDSLEIQQNLLRLARFAAANQEQANEGARQLLIVLSQVPEIRDGNQVPCERLLNQLLTQYNAYLGFGVFDPEGNLICSAPAATAPLNAADREYFRRAKAARTFVIGDYQMGRITQKASLSTAYPIIAATGEVKGVVMAAIDLTWLNQLATEVEFPEGSVLTVTDRNGTILVRHPNPQNWVGLSFPDHPTFADMLSQHEGTLESPGLDGIRRLYAFTALGQGQTVQDLYIRIGIPKSVGFARSNRLLARNLIGLALVTMLAIAAAWIGGDIFLVRKLHQLVQTTQQLRRGRFHSRTNLTREPGELGMLARAFDSMAAALELRERAIANLNQNLQHQLDALHQSKEQLQFALSVGQMGSWNWDLHTNAVTWSEGHFRLLGLDPYSCEPTYQLWYDRIHPDDVTATEAALQRAMQEQAEFHHEYRIFWPDGSVHWLDARGRFSCDPQAQPQQMAGIVIDITERKQAEQQREALLERERAAREEAETANRIKDEFLAVLSHELRSPLNPILGWARLLQERPLNDRTRQQALATIERNARLQTQLVDDLLDVSRILQGKITLQISMVRLGAVIEAAIETVQLAADAKSIHIEYSSVEDTADILVLGDAARLQQIVWNLLSNAVKFTPNGGRVEVALERSMGDCSWNLGSTMHPDGVSFPPLSATSECVQITVSDTGKGIKPNFLPHVFDYFRQEDGKTTRRFGGLGLGLAIVRHLTELHGGTVAVDSPGEDQGATFRICLPLPRSESLPVEDGVGGPALPCAPLTGLRILVVDDEADTRSLVKFIMHQQHVRVKAVASAAEALVLLEQFQPHLVISDIGMPNMDGYTLVRQIRQRSPDQGGNIPAIALTAYASEGDRQQALGAGFQRHLTKPIDPNELLQAISGLVLQG